ncbi:helix-turn-helix domain-containing protein [Saccharophagus degradans]|uniref:Helix-turn-helix domain-containing protein n=1 Tax=Saccharophagus degradans TaxID=86304 RepID=A0AAW7X4N9_9GAMM|nr:helix-turn-helix domain-containing protein [Saccharophagus degradans]MDO6421943.1 helix-turn-helix domain-containing protein [Saccharophagus degradans]MDO6606364.1 helix-turn-helix domain-containing protein [Saccharophagus degradans]
MGDRIFNVYDVFLIIAVFEALLLAVFRMVLPTSNRSGKWGSYFLAAFLIVVSVDFITGLLMWNDAIPLSQSFYSNGLVLLFTFSHFTRGPLFYFYVRALLFSGLQLRARHCIHALPALLAVVGVCVFGITTEDLQSRSGDVNTTQMASVIWYASNGLSIFYAAYALVWLQKYLQRLKEQFSSISSIEISWLMVLSGCFLISWSWSILINLSADLIGGGFADAMGTSHNLIRFMLMNGLVFYSLVCTSKIVNVRYREPKQVAGKDSKGVVEQIEWGIHELQLHLFPSINIDQYAEKIGVNAKAVSNALNRDLKTRFFEFINAHRVEEAKRLLEDSSKNNLSIAQIYTAAGFNNKSSFHRFFSRLVGMSPSEYRQQAQRGK